MNMSLDSVLGMDIVMHASQYEKNDPPLQGRKQC